MSELKRTPLSDFHQRHGARMVPFAGWEMPVQYTSILEEHMAVRNQAGLFDVSHMGEARVKGPQACDFMETAMTNRFRKLKPGRARYTLMCQEDGGVVDDLIVYRIAEDEYLICLNASNADKDVRWLQNLAKDYDCTVTDESTLWAQVALQGPATMKVVKAVAGEEAGDLKRFAFCEAEVAGAQVLVSRTGYTGEDGVEIYCAMGDAEAVAEALLKAGEPEGVILAGLGARDSLRLEAGMPLYGHEISDSINPLEAGLSGAVKLDKPEDFVGKATLARIAEAGPARRLVYYTLEDRRIARQGAPVCLGTETVGEVVSGTQSPVLGKPIGSALVQAGAPDDGLEVDVRGKRYAMKVQQPPLVNGSPAKG